MDSFVELLLSLAEKSSKIARLLHQDKGLFDTLVEEKRGEGKNKRFRVDYKTLADTLIQEIFKHFIAERFPQLHNFIFGEESNLFTLPNGETMVVSIGPTPSDTICMLSRLLSDRLARVLGDAIHEETRASLREEVRERVRRLNYLKERQLGMWIDPLDGTNEYVEGITGFHSDDGIYSRGLQCVTILVGVYDRTTGQPILGLINQPFHNLDDEEVWHGRSIWGIAEEGVVETTLPFPNEAIKSGGDKKICLVSSSEDSSLIEKIGSGNEWKTRRVAGCGYKLLSVITGLADAYILSKDTSYKWDTCGPHAILIAMGGNIESFHHEGGDAGGTSTLLYNTHGEDGERDKRWANKDGIVAYLSKETLSSLHSIMQSYKHEDKHYQKPVTIMTT